MNEPQGYFAVLEPKRLEWQGFFLPIGSPTLERLAAEVRGLAERTAKTESGFEVERSTPGYTREQEALVGFVSAVLMEFYYRRDPGHVGAAALVLHQLTGKRFFVVIGQVADGRDGLRTSIEHLDDVGSPDEARSAIERHPRVLAIKFQRALLGLKHGESPKA